MFQTINDLILSNEVVQYLKTEPWETDAAKKPKQSVILLVVVIKKTLNCCNKKGAVKTQITGI